MPLYPGKPVLYRFRPGAVRMGQTEAAAMITRIYQDGTCDLTVYPPSSPEPLFQNRVPQMVREDDFHCWRFNDDEQRMVELERKLAELLGAQVNPRSLGDAANDAQQTATGRRVRPRSNVTETA